MTAMANGRVGSVDSLLADQITVALHTLRGRGRRLAMRRLALALANQRRTGDTAVVEQFIESLVFTARMESTPAYSAAMKQVPEPDEGRDVADVVALLEAHDRDPGT